MDQKPGSNDASDERPFEMEPDADFFDDAQEHQSQPEKEAFDFDGQEGSEDTEDEPTGEMVAEIEPDSGDALKTEEIKARPEDVVQDEGEGADEPAAEAPEAVIDETAGRRLAATMPLWECGGKKSPVHQAIFSTDGGFVITCVDRGVIELRDRDNGVVKQSFPGVGKNVTSIACTFDGSGVLAGYSDGRIIMWDVSRCSKRYEIKRRKHRLTALCVFPGDEFAATTHSDGTIHLWDLAEKKQMNATDVSDGTLSATGLAMSPPGTNVIAAVEGGELVFFRLVTKTERTQLRLNDDPKQIAYKFAATCAAFLPDGARFIFGQKNGIVRVGQLSFEDKPRPLIQAVCQQDISALAVNPVKPQIAVGCIDGTLERWSIPDEVCASHYPLHEGAIRSAVFSPDGERLAAVAEDGLLRCYDTSKISSNA